MAKEGFHVFKFSWSPYEDAPKEDYEVSVTDVELGPPPELFKVFVLNVKSSKGYEFVGRKKLANFDELQREVIKYCPQWDCVFCPQASGKGGSFLSSLTGAHSSDADLDDSLLWKRCTDIAEQFVRDYEEHKEDPVLETPGFLGDSVGLNLRTAFRCLFFLQRDTVIDRLVASGKWRVENSISLTNHLGNRLFMRHFNPYDPKNVVAKPDADPDAIVIIVHGYADQGDGDAHQRAAREYSANNLLVYSVDAHGCGRSDGPRMLVRDYMNLVEDHDLLLQEVIKKYPGKKIFLLGISMGGGLSFFLGLKRRAQLAGCLFLAPMVEVSPSQSPFMQRLAPFMAAVAPYSKVVTFDTNRMNHDPYHQRRYSYQAYSYLDKVVTITGFQMLRLTQHAWKRLEEFHVPLVIFHGSDDNVTSLGGSQALLARAGVEDKALEVIHGAYHDLLLEPASAEKMYATMVSWIKERI